MHPNSPGTQFSKHEKQPYAQEAPYYGERNTSPCRTPYFHRADRASSSFFRAAISHPSRSEIPLTQTRTLCEHLAFPCGDFLRNVASPPRSPQSSGPDDTCAIRALVAAMMVMASAASPVPFGWMIDVGITMDAILYMSVGFTTVSVVLIFMARRAEVRDTGSAD
jgi:hypothetical protein